MNRLILISLFSILTVQIMAQEKIVQTAGREQLTNDKLGIEGFKFSPDGKKVILIKELPYHGSIKENPSDLPLATGRLVTDLNYQQCLLPYIPYHQSGYHI